MQRNNARNTFFSFLLYLIIINLIDALQDSLTFVSYHDVTHLNTSNNGRGGASRVAQVIEDLRSKDNDLLVLLSGDTMSPSLLSSLFKGTQMLDAHHLLRLDFASLGNHEFDYGLEAFTKFAKASKFPWLNANCYEISSQKLVANTIPHEIKKVKNTVIGIFGVMYDIKDNSTGLYWTDPIEAARTQVAALKGKGAEFIIALTHQNWQNDNILSASVSGIDLIFGGHDSKAMLQTAFGTPVFKSNSEWENLFVTKIRPISGGKGYSIHAELIDITSDMSTNEKMEKKLQEIETKAASLYTVEIGENCNTLDLRNEALREKENQFANYITDLMRMAYENKTEVALLVGSDIYSDTKFSNKKVTVGDIAKWFPHPSVIFTVKVTTVQLKKLIEKWMVGSCKDKGSKKQNSNFLHPAGFSYVFECTGDGKGSVKEVKWIQDNAKNRKVFLDNAESFILALNDWLYSASKEIIDPIGENIIIDNKGAIPLNVLVQHAVNKSSICPKLENRVVVL